MNIHLEYQTGGRAREASDFHTDDYDLCLEQTEADGRIKVSVLAKKPLVLKRCAIRMPCTYAPDCRIFVNGYQSWTDAREYELSEEIHTMRRVPGFIRGKFHFDAYGDTWFYSAKKGCYHSFTYSYVRQPDGDDFFIGSFNEANAYLIAEHDPGKNVLALYSDCDGRALYEGERFCLYDYVSYHGKARESVQRYFSGLGSSDAPSVRGYTSWYLHYQDITEAKMLDALSAVDREHFDLFQIDDGYETWVGDWMDIDPVKFPGGLRPLVDKIHAKGLQAGIWLAPFVCELKSRLFREHPEWIYRADGAPVFAGNNWSGDVVLDIRRRDVQDYIRECLRYFMDCGFDFFKLDFLYAAALVVEGGRFTRAEIMRKAMEGLRKILGDKRILGCGVPLSSAFQLVDYCRIGPDVSLKFDDVFYMRMMHRERISTKTTLQNTIFRQPMDGHVFRCDPDVYLLRKDHISLSKEQRKALVMLNHLCGAVYMTSDQVGQYDDDTRAVLMEAEKLRDAVLKEVSKEGNILTVQYELQGNEYVLRYDRARGVLLP